MALNNASSYVNEISKVLPGTENTITFAYQYIFSLPSLVKQGDYFAILISLILIYAAIIVLNKISGLFLIVLKKIMSLAVMVLALMLIYTKFMDNIELEGLTIKTWVIGLSGIAIAILGTIISFYSLFSSTKKAISKGAIAKEMKEESLKDTKPEIDINQLKEFKTFFSLDSLKNDKSLLSVLTFLVVAEFGVFSSVTITAPNIRIGIIMFSIFIILSFVFIKQSYKDYKKGMVHIVVTFVLGSVLAVVLGHYWANIPFSTLLSIDIFKTSCLVALISGMALSLFAGSRS